MKNSLSLFKTVWGNIYEHKFTYLLNTSLLQLFMLTVGSFLLSLIFKLILLVSGETNLSQVNFREIISNPYSILLILLMFLCFTFFVFLEYSVLTMMVYSKMRDTHFSLKTITKNAFKKVKTLISGQYIVCVGYFLLLFPIANFGVSSVLLGEIYIPKFITAEIVKTNLGLTFYIIGIIALFYINIRLIFVLPLVMISKDSLTASIRHSIILTSLRRLSWFWCILLFELVILVILILFFLILIIILSLIDSSGNNLIVQTIFYTLISGGIFFLTTMSKIFIITTLVKVISDNKIVAEEIYTHKKEERRQSKFLVILILFAVTGSVFYNAYKLHGAELNENVKVIGHRGYTASGVENSLEALEGAARVGVDYVEVDIVLTKDNQFVVIHDNNLKRLANINKKVRESNLSEIVNLPITQEVYSSKISSLDDFIKKAKELDINLLVEIKPYGGEPDNLDELLINKLAEYEVLNKYKIMSLDLKLMEKINTKHKEIEVGYVIPILFGTIGENNVDFYVVEDFSYTFTFASQSRDANKQIYVWTLNDADRIENYLQAPIDGIITDEPLIVKESKRNLKEYNRYFDRLIRFVINKI